MQSDKNDIFYTLFAVCLMLTIGLSVWGLIVTSIWYGSARMIVGWGVTDQFVSFNRVTYKIRMRGNMAVYASEVTFLLSIVLYCIYFFDTLTAIITSITTS